MKKQVQKEDVYVIDPEATQIAGKLNKDAIPTLGVYKNQSVNANYELKNQKSNLWNASQAGIIIRNEVYIGTFIGRKLSTVRLWKKE